MNFNSFDDTLIYCESHFAKEPKGSLLLVHGLGEHSGRYNEFISFCIKQKLDVHCLDLRGHGRSHGTRGHFNTMEDHLNDIKEWTSYLVEQKKLSRKNPIYLFGHSFGGLVALEFAALCQKQSFLKIESLILSSPALGLQLSPFAKVEALVAKSLPGMLKSIQVPVGIAAEFLSHDEKVVEDYKHDPLVHGWITPAAFSAIEAAVSNLGRTFKYIQIPVLFLVAGKDKVVDATATLKFASKLSVAHPGLVEVKVFHTFFHENFNELKKQYAYLELKKWIYKCRKHQQPSSKKNLSKSFAKEVIAKETSH